MRLLLICFLAACSADPVDSSDLEAEDAPVAAKADAASPWVGLYRTHATTHQDGDVVNLALGADGSFVRERCYHAACARPLAETDKVDSYTSSAGKTYVRFHALGTVADVYEIVKTSSGVKLRKSYTTRWFTLYRTTAAEMCKLSGGTGGSACTCGSNEFFAPGAGGCIATKHDDESNCDASGGQWTDDDATLIGTYCACGVGLTEDPSTGSCVSI